MTDPFTASAGLAAVGGAVNAASTAICNFLITEDGNIRTDMAQPVTCLTPERLARRGDKFDSATGLGVYVSDAQKYTQEITYIRNSAWYFKASGKLKKHYPKGTGVVIATITGKAVSSVKNLVGITVPKGWRQSDTFKKYITIDDSEGAQELSDNLGFVPAVRIRVPMALQYEVTTISYQVPITTEDPPNGAPAQQILVSIPRDLAQLTAVKTVWAPLKGATVTIANDPRLKLLRTKGRKKTYGFKVSENYLTNVRMVPRGEVNGKQMKNAFNEKATLSFQLNARSDGNQDVVEVIWQSTQQGSGTKAKLIARPRENQGVMTVTYSKDAQAPTLDLGTGEKYFIPNGAPAIDQEAL